MVFVMETKCLARCMFNLKFSLGFHGCLAVDSEGQSGGLICFGERKSI